MKKLIYYLSQGLSLLGGFIILYGCYGIFSRAVFKFQDLWFNDFMLMVLVSILWLFSIIVVVERRETAMEALPDALHGRKKAIFRAILDIISGLCCFCLGLSGIVAVTDLLKLNLNISTVFPVPQWVPVLCFIAGMLGSSTAFFVRAIGSIWLKHREG